MGRHNIDEIVGVDVGENHGQQMDHVQVEMEDILTGQEIFD